ncbi:MAG: ATP-binding protein [Candidatus Babeliales bacterium]|jgi:hypothetical protein
MLIQRHFWQQLIEKAWKQRTIIWLMGVRRVGKTHLCQSLPDIEYFDCELPHVRQLLEDPEAFLTSKKGKRLVFDEIHRLDNPSEILKIAADHYPEVFIIATGSSTLGASAKFKDTLTGRKKELWLTPLLLSEIGDFGNEDIRHRMLFGGLPSFFASENFPEDEFKEWSDAYWAKDIQDMFSVGKRYSFQKFTELLLAQSGGQFEASTFAAPCEVSRQTISNYLAILEATFVVHVIRPYSTRKANEIVMAPKVYGFDTGFVCYARGWRELRKEDQGLLWEQCVLNEIHAHLQTHSVNYWRDKQGHEIDFVLRNKVTQELTAIECKFSSSSLSKNRPTDSAFSTNIEAFRQHYPHGKNYIVASDIVEPFERRYDDTVITFINTRDLVERLR